jgi:hypothetical protein
MEERKMVKMNRTVLLIVALLCLFSIPIAGAIPIVTYEEHFDNFPQGTFPLGFGYVYSGRGWDYAVTDANQWVSPGLSLKLEGSGGWSQYVGIRIPAPSDAGVVYDYQGEGLPDNEYLETVAWLQDHPVIWFDCNVTTAERPAGFSDDLGLAQAGFYKVTPLWGQRYGDVYFNYNPTSGYYIRAGSVTVPYEPWRWYHVKIRTDLISRTQTVWIDGSEITRDDPVGISSGYWPEMLELSAENGGSYTTAWYDDVRIGYYTAPAEDVQMLKSDVIALDLPHGIEKSCVVKLESAARSIDEGRYDDAVGQLTAFINHVKAQSGKKIPIGDAAVLIATASQIIDELSD